MTGNLPLDKPDPREVQPESVERRASSQACSQEASDLMKNCGPQNRANDNTRTVTGTPEGYPPAMQLREDVQKQFVPADPRIKPQTDALFNPNVSAEQKLSIVQGLNNAGIKELAYRDQTGDHTLRLETIPVGAGGRSMVHLFGTDENGQQRTILRGISNGDGSFRQEKNPQGQEVDYYGLGRNMLDQPNPPNMMMAVDGRSQQNLDGQADPRLQQQMDGDPRLQQQQQLDPRYGGDPRLQQQQQLDLRYGGDPRLQQQQQLDPRYGGDPRLQQQQQLGPRYGGDPRLQQQQQLDPRYGGDPRLQQQNQSDLYCPNPYPENQGRNPFHKYTNDGPVYMPPNLYDRTTTNPDGGYQQPRYRQNLDNDYRVAPPQDYRMYPDNGGQNNGYARDNSYRVAPPQDYRMYPDQRRQDSGYSRPDYNPYRRNPGEQPFDGQQPYDNPQRYGMDGLYRNPMDRGNFYAHQNDSRSCSAFSMAMMASDWSTGRPPSAQESYGWKRIAGTLEHGYRGSLNDVARNIQEGCPGIQTKVYNYGMGRVGQQAMGDLNRELDAGRTAVAKVINPHTGNPHYIYIAGRTRNGEYILGDPDRKNPHQEPISGARLQRMMGPRDGFVVGWKNQMSEASRVQGSAANRYAIQMAKMGRTANG